MKTKYYLTLFVVSFFIGCSINENDNSSEVLVSIQGNTETLRKVIKVELNANGWNKTLTGADIGTPNLPNYSQSFVTPKSGNIKVKFTLLDSTGLHSNSGNISLPVKSDWRWSVDFVLSNRNPFNSCFGCIGYSSFKVDSVFQKSNEDSLFVVWGGNSIKSPVIY